VIYRTITLEQWVEEMKTARRPITQDPIRLRRRRDETDIPAELSLVDQYIADHERRQG